MHPLYTVYIGVWEGGSDNLEVDLNDNLEVCPWGDLVGVTSG